MANVSDALKNALHYHQAGRLQEAEALYRQILEAEPDNSEALHLLGVVAHQTGQHDVAVRYIQQAIARSPHVARFHNNLGEAYRAQGRLAEALVHYRRAVALKPEYVEAHTNLGTALKAQGKLEEGLAHYRQALVLAPNSADALNNFGLALQEQGKLAEAVAHYRRALEFRQAFPEAHNNLANALKAQGKPEEAVTHYRQALALNPTFPEANNNLGIALHEQGKLDEAVTHFRQAVELRPAFPEAHNNLALSLKEQGNLEAAVTHLRRALEIKPDYPEAYNSLGSVRKDQGRLEEAVVCCQRALTLKPDFPEAQNNLGLALHAMGRTEDAVASFQRALALRPDFAEAHNSLGLALHTKGKLGEALIHFRQALALRPDFAVAYSNLGRVPLDQGNLDDAIAYFRKALSLQPSSHSVHSNLLFCLNYHPELSPEEIFREYQTWNDRHALPLARHTQPHANSPDPMRRLRVGYVSPDFARHSCHYFVEPLLAAHDRAAVEVFAYSDVVRSDEVTERLRNLVDHWYDTMGVSDAALAEMIRQHQIDILVDLAGHTSGNRLLVFARKPAPVQVTCIGYGYTTGLSAMDYFMGNASLVPDGAEALFSEKVFRLWHPPFCYRPPENMPPASPLPARANGYITFACFSRPTRVNRRVIAVWAQILTAVPTARLVLNHQPYVDGSTRDLFLAHFAAHGVDPQRIVLDYSSPWQALNRIDIALDPFPHNAGTTTLEALWMGVPVISLVDRPPLGRIGAMILRSLHLPEWLADGEADYVRIAVEASRNPDRLPTLRANLRHRMRASPLLDETGFARELEAAYRTMWHRWCRGPFPLRQMMDTSPGPSTDSGDTSFHTFQSTQDSSVRTLRQTHIPS